MIESKNMKNSTNGKKTTVIAIITVILIGGGIYAYSAKKNIDPVTQPVTEQVTTVVNSTSTVPVQTATKTPTPTAKDASVSVEESFNAYKTAILAQDGDQAAIYVNSQTIAYYSDLLRLVKSGTKSEVQSKRLIDKFSIFAIRFRFAPEMAGIKDGKSLLSFAVNEGLIGERSVSALKYSSADILGNLAIVTLKTNDAISTKLKFTKEDGLWKIDLVEMLPDANIAFTESARKTGYSEDEFIFMLLESLTGTKPTEKVWEPLN